MKTNSMFKIESNIPPPERSLGRRSKYPLREMKIGDSFSVPSEVAEAATVRSACSYFAIRNKEYRFSIRKEEGATRVWRIKC